MTIAAILLTDFALMIFILTRTTYVYIKYNRVFSLEFHFVIFSLTLDLPAKNNTDNIAHAFYPILLKRITNLIECCYIRVIRISIKNKRNERFEYFFPASYGRFALISAILAYLNNKSKKITIEQNAIVLNPDNAETAIDIRLYTELFKLLSMLFKLLFDLKKFSKKKEV